MGKKGKKKGKRAKKEVFCDFFDKKSKDFVEFAYDNRATISNRWP